jgi:Domain of unknown function (DUF1906)
MRRAIAAAVMGGLVLGGSLATPALAAPPKAGKAVSPKAATRTVVYAGYEFQVPASWPVYRLDEYPRTCVRYDVNAVYLGAPGPDMKCPAGLVGRVETVTFTPGHTPATGSGAGIAGQSQGPGSPIQQLPAVHSSITQQSAQLNLQVKLGSGGAGGTVTATYATDPVAVRRALGSLRPAPSGTPDTAQSAARAPQQSSPSRAALDQEHSTLAAAPAAAAAAPSPTYSNWRGVPPHWPIEIIAPSPKPSTHPAAKPVGGFDTCTAPPLTTMKAWRSDYAAAGIYIGGANTACASGNLSASWISAVAALGYGMLPTYVGRQAPCWNGGNGLLITAANAAAQGADAGADAVRDARHYGLPQGSPVYYDMEAYVGSDSCKNAVLMFLGAWDRTVVAGGYLTGVYSSQDSGIADMQSAAVARTGGFTAPNAVWFALWDNSATLADGTLAWPATARNKQYSGNVNATVGGITLNIDKDIVGGPVAR